MRISQVLTVTTLLFAVLAWGGPSPTFATADSAFLRPSGAPSPAPQSCEDFAQRQIRLADRLLRKSSYRRALKVLNSTAENCNIGSVREKIVEVLGEWYGVVQRQGTSSLQQFINILSAQRYVSAAQKQRFKNRIKDHVQNLIEDQHESQDYRAAYRICQSYSDYASGTFEVEYYCGTAAEEMGASNAAMDSYQWLLENWSSDQSLTSWEQLSTTLEEMYFFSGRFQDAYALARRDARRDPTPKAVLSSLVSIRGKFLSPVVRMGSIFYGAGPSGSVLSHVDSEMQKVNFPKYVQAFYLLGADGSVQRGMYGDEANQPSVSRLQQATGSVSLLQSEDSNLVWLVSPLDGQFLVLEFNVATTPEEGVRLESVYENINNDKQWQELYDLEFTEVGPATGTALGTFLGAASLAGQSLNSYDALFDDSPLLTYYCIQNGSGTIDESYNFSRVNLGYGDSEWERTSTTPALYHHSVTYNGESVREVVWPKFVDDEWAGVIRVGLTRS